jgi:ABC-type sugar transport system substrate-binding protein
MSTHPKHVGGRRWGRDGAAAIVAAVVAVALAACSSSSKSEPDATSGSSSSTSPSPTSPTTEAAAVAIPAPATAAPTAINVTLPLKSAPAKGVVIGALTCSLPSCAPYTKGLKDATTVLGWTLKEYPYQASSLASVQSAMQQAIDAKVSYIALHGFPTAAYKQQLAAAKAAGIPVLNGGAPGPADTASGNPTNFGNDVTFQSEGTSLGQWILRDNGASSAHVALVSLPDYPILAGLTAGLKQSQTQYCPTGCSVSELPVTGQDLGGGAIAAKVVAYLQSHPDVNYLAFAFSDLYPGVYNALKQAGLTSKVKLVGFSLSAPTVAAFQQGQIAAWGVFSLEFMSWLQVDAAARLSVGMTITDPLAPLPNYVVTNAQDAAATGGFWEGPTGFQDSFKRLWLVK